MKIHDGFVLKWIPPIKDVNDPLDERGRWWFSQIVDGIESASCISSATTDPEELEQEMFVVIEYFLGILKLNKGVK